MRVVSDDYFGRLNRFAAHAERFERRRHQSHGQSFARAGNRIERARRQLAKPGHAATAVGNLFDDRIELRLQHVTPRGVSDQRRERLGVLGREQMSQLIGRALVTAGGTMCGVHQRVGHAGHRGKHDDDFALTRGCGHDFGSFADALRAADRSAAKLHHL